MWIEIKGILYNLGTAASVCKMDKREMVKAGDRCYAEIPERVIISYPSISVYEQGESAYYEQIDCKNRLERDSIFANIAHCIKNNITGVE